MIDQSHLRTCAARLFRAAPQFRGKTRAIRMINHVLNRISRKPFGIATVNGEDRFVLDLRSRTEFVSYYTGRYDEAAIRKLLSLIGENWIILDVGANIGFYSVPFARCLKGSGGKLICFEPVSGNAARLKENLSLNGLTGPQVEISPLALSDRAGRLRISLREDFLQGGETGNAAVWIDDQQDSRFESIWVEAMRLDDFLKDKAIDRVDLIKVDIEGHEDLFLKGATETLRRFRPLVLSEFNPDYFRRRGMDLEAWMKQFLGDFDYVLFRLGQDGRWMKAESLAGRGNTDDVFLIPREKISDVIDKLNPRLRAT